MPRTSAAWLTAQLLLLAGIFVVGWRSWADAGIPWLSISGGALMLGSLALAIRGFLDLGKNLSPGPHPVQSNTLVTRGVYSRIRHPLYSSLVLLAAGWSVFTHSAGAAFGSLALLVFLWKKSRREEIELQKIHPGYETYANRTGGFVPRLGRSRQRVSERGGTRRNRRSF